MAAQVRSGRSCLLDRGFVILPVALLLNAPLQLPGGHGGNPAGEPPFFAFPDTPSVNNLTPLCSVTIRTLTSRPFRLDRSEAEFRTLDRVG
jgi:hypothetical protein